MSLEVTAPSLDIGARPISADIRPDQVAQMGLATDRRRRWGPSPTEVGRPGIGGPHVRTASLERISSHQDSLWLR